MKNVLFYGPRVLATVALIVALSFLGSGNPKVVPFYVLFFTVLFLLIFFLNKRSKESQREEKSGTILTPIMQIAGLVIFVGALSLFGMIHGIIGFIVWFLLLSLIVVAIYFRLRNHQRHFELTSSNPALKYVVAGIFALLSILLPLLMIRFGGSIPIAAGKEVMAIILGLIAILLFVCMMGLAMFMINKWGAKSMNRVIGYLIIIVAAILPGIIILFVSQDSRAIAGAYMAALVALIFSYFALETSIKIS